MAALVAVALAGCGSSAPSLTVFKAGFKADKARFRKLGLDLESAIGGAKTKTDAQLAAELRPLSARARQQATQLAKLNPPAKYKHNVAEVRAGFDAISVDLKRIAVAATHNDAHTASAATRALIADATRVHTADVAISGALGINS